mmetsp:Transcript_42402/g.42966  ORF Transcript_42402/g.42966 Transcript_42402/m.42966 type:complete len:81 (+) Transcript_42402:382-624(+)
MRFLDPGWPQSAQRVASKDETNANPPPSFAGSDVPPSRGHPGRRPRMRLRLSRCLSRAGAQHRHHSERDEGRYAGGTARS